MTLQNNTNDVTVRKLQSTISSSLVRCVCVTASFVSTGCALLGLGLTCFFLRLFDHSAAACPRYLTVSVFGAAGALFALGFILICFICRRKRRLKKEALLEDLPEVCEGGVPQYKKKLSATGEVTLQSVESVGGDDSEKRLEDEDSSLPPPEPLTSDERDHFEMTQISADVSNWIEQQEAGLPAASESFCLEIVGGATSQQPEQDNSEGEITAL